MAIGAIWGDIWDESIWDNGIWAVSFDLLSATVPADGGSVRIGFASAASFGAGGNGGFTVNLSGGACTLTYSSGDGTSTLVYTTSRTIAKGETGTLSYVQPGNGVEDGTGADLGSFSGFVLNIPRLTDVLSINRSIKDSITDNVNL